MNRTVRSFSFLVMAGVIGLAQSACSPGTEQADVAADCAGYSLAGREADVPPWPAEHAVPETLEQSLAALDEWLSESQKQYFRCTDSTVVLAGTHFGLALWIRNNWNLYSGNPLSEALRAMGLRHPDDMSNLVAVQYIQTLRGEPVDVERIVKESQAHWDRMQQKDTGQGQGRDD